MLLLSVDVWIYSTSISDVRAVDFYIVLNVSVLLTCICSNR